MRFLRSFLASLSVAPALGVGLLLLASFAGAVHPAGDALAVFRPALVGIGVTSALLAFVATRRREWLLAAVGVACIGLTVLPPRSAPPRSPHEPVFVHYQKNLYFQNPAPHTVIADIRRQAPDFVTLQEVTDRLRPVLAGTGLRTQLLCPFAGVGGVAVASKWPAEPGTASCADGVARVQVRTPVGRVWVASVHLHWPWPYGQAAQVARAWPEFAEAEGPWVIGGDFNMVPWSHTIGRLRRHTDTIVASGHRRSFDVAHLYPLAIDHVLVPEQAGVVSVDLRPRLGSDHDGVVVRFALR